MREDGDGARYRARQDDLGRCVILRIAAAPAGSPEAERFLARAQQLIDLDHPNVRRVYEAGVADGHTYAVTADVQGIPLSLALAEGGMSADRATNVVSQLASAGDALRQPGGASPALALEEIVLDSSGAASNVYVDGLATAPPDASRAVATTADGLAQVVTTLVAGAVEGRPAVEKLPSLLRSVVEHPDSYGSGSALAHAARAGVREHERRRRRRRVAFAAGAGGAAVVAVVIVAVVALSAGGERAAPAPAAASNAPAARIVATIPLGGKVGAVGFGDHGVWVNVENGRLFHVDARTARVVGRPIDVGKHFAPTAIAVGGGSVWSSVSGTLVRIDPASGKVTGRLHLGPAILGITYAERQVWVGVSSPPGVERVINELVRVDAATMRRVGHPVPVGYHPGDIVVRGGTAYVINTDAGTITRVDTASETARTVRASAQVTYATLAGSTLWATSPTDGTVIPLDVSSLQLPSTVIRINQPFGVAALAGALWVTAYEGPFPTRGRVRLFRIDPGARRVAGRALELGEDAGLAVPGDAALWVGSSSRHALLKVVPTSPAPRPVPAPPPERSPRRLQAGPLAIGEWRADDFTPRVRFTIADRGWLTTTAPGLIGLARNYEPDLFVTVAAPRHVLTGDDRLRRATSSDTVLAVFRSNSRLRVRAEAPVDIGGVRATRLDVEVIPGRRVPPICGAPCAPIFPFPGGTYLLAAATDNRVYVMNAAGRVVLVTVEVPRGSPQRDFDLADRLVRTLRFGDSTS